MAFQKSGRIRSRGGRLAFCLSLSLLAAAGPANSAAINRSFCAELERTMEAIRLGDVVALERSRARPPSFGFRFCGAQGNGWYCHQSLAPPHLSRTSLAAAVVECQPDLRQTQPTSPDYDLFQGDGVRIRIEESGARGAHVGRIVIMSIEPSQPD